MKKMTIAVLMTVLLMAAPVMAATYTNAVGGPSLPASGLGKAAVVENTLDFAGENYTTNDIIKMLLIDSNQVVEALTWEVVTTNSATACVSLGTSLTAAKYATDLDINSKGAAIGSTTGFLFTAAGDIRVTLTNAVPTAGKLRVRAFVLDMGK